MTVLQTVALGHLATPPLGAWRRKEIYRICEKSQEILSGFFDSDFFVKVVRAGLTAEGY